MSTLDESRREHCHASGAITWLRDDQGATTSVVFLHGFAGTMHAWLPVAHALVSPVQAIAIALPGHHPSVPVQPTFEQNAQLLSKTLQGHLTHSRIVLVGYSMGARLALAMALEHRLSIAHLTLISGHFGLVDDLARKQRRLADAKWAELLEKHGMDAFLQQWEAQPLFAHQQHHPLAEAQRLFRREHDTQQLAHAMRNMSLAQMPSYWQQLHRLEIPTRLIVGSFDTKFVQLAEQAHALLPQARLERIANCGHNPLIQTPEILAEKLF